MDRRVVDGQASPGRVDHAQMRSANMSLILRTLRADGGRSRAKLAAETGLSRATMSSLVTELGQRGLVREGAIDRDGTVGRPGTTVALDPGHCAGVGASISVDYLAVTTVDLTGKVIRDETRALPVRDLAPDEVIDQLAEMVRDVLGGLAASGHRVAGLTIAPPGVIDYESGAVRFAPNIGWRNVPIMARLSERLDEPRPPLAMENDAKLSALAEHTRHASDGIWDLVFLTGDVGVGAGIIAGGRLVRGWNGFSGEVGHLPLDPELRQCTCGRRGCWETLVGERALLERAACELDEVQDASVPIADRLQVLADRARDGDVRVLEALQAITTDLARGISVVVDVLNPRMVVLGGWFVQFEQWILAPLRELVRLRLMDQDAQIVLTMSRLGPTSAALGGAMAAIERVFDDPAVMDLLD